MERVVVAASAKAFGMNGELSFAAFAS